MYHLNEFCNIIAALRREKGWTQQRLAEKLRVAPQSVSKWECGIGYPDVTLFPTIAETFGVPIGVLFGETHDEKERLNPDVDSGESERKYAFPMPGTINVNLGNLCRVELVELDENAAESGLCVINVTGDSVFLSYFNVEELAGVLYIDVKNPSGSMEHWQEYDRRGFAGENLVVIYAGREVNFYSNNFLDLLTETRENERGNYEVVCRRM